MEDKAQYLTDVLFNMIIKMARESILNELNRKDNEASAYDDDSEFNDDEDDFEEILDSFISSHGELRMGTHDGNYSDDASDSNDCRDEYVMSRRQQLCIGFEKERQNRLARKSNTKLNRTEGKRRNREQQAMRKKKWNEIDNTMKRKRIQGNDAKYYRRSKYVPRKSWKERKY